MLKNKGIKNERKSNGKNFKKKKDREKERKKIKRQEIISQKREIAERH